MKSVLTKVTGVAAAALAASAFSLLPASAAPSPAEAPLTMVASVPGKPTPLATPDSAACLRNGPNRDGTVVTATTTGAAIRNGSSTGCPAVGQVNRGNRLTYYCYTVAGSYTWTFLHDTSTGKIGWVRDDLLPRDGSSQYCGF